ncbi:ATP-dependent DNA helicase PIF1, partial [Linum grandiflorum]
KLFGGKKVLLGCDFRKTLPVVTNGLRGDNLSACLTQSYLWSHCKMLRLHTNMRLNTSTANAADLFEGMPFPEWILALGEANPITSLVAHVYTDLITSYKNISYLRSRAIVAPTNHDVTLINDYILTQLPGDTKVYLSADTLTTIDSKQTKLEIQYPTEFLNGLSFNGMPGHELHFKQYIIVMLLRNLNPAAGLCNGTRILITHLGNNVIRGLIVGGTFEGTVVIIPHIVLPASTYYGMTNNKSQGQTLDHIGVYFPTPVFSHSQLYVALSRLRSTWGIHIALENATAPVPETTRNIVYKEIFEDILLPSSIV